jgi:hypothetical protein
MDKSEMLQFSDCNLLLSEHSRAVLLKFPNQLLVRFIWFKLNILSPNCTGFRRIISERYVIRWLETELRQMCPFSTKIRKSISWPSKFIEAPFRSKEASLCTIKANLAHGERTFLLSEIKRELAIDLEIIASVGNQMCPFWGSLRNDLGSLIPVVSVMRG